MGRCTQWGGGGLAAAAAVTSLAAASPTLAQAPVAAARPGRAQAHAGSTAPMSEASRQWVDFANELGNAGMRIHELADGTRTPEQQGEVNQALIWALSSAVLSFSRMDPDYPDWIPILNSAMLGINNNNDNVYQFARIRGKGSYKIEGDRGKLKFLFLQLSNGMPGMTEKSSLIGNYDLNEMKLNSDGKLEVLLSPTRPNGYAGNWIALDPNADDTFVVLRHVSYDWKTDRDANLSIQRIDTPVAMPRRQASDTGQRLASMPKYVESIMRTFFRIQDDQGFMKGEANTFTDGTKGFGDASSTNLTQQRYYMGEARIRSDQALVLESEIPKSCEYWAVMLMDSAANTLDFMFHQSGLNGRSARVDPDGKVRIVISEKDPGVANWLDKGSYEVNGVRGRFYKCGAPVWTSRVTSIDGVAEALYPGTPKVSYDERQKQLRERIRQVQHRRRW